MDYSRQYMGLTSTTVR